MRFVRSAFVVLAAIALAWAPRVALAQQADPYVSCVKCHALPMTQAQGQMEQHGMGYLPSPEMACTQCHNTIAHEQNPDVPAYPRYFLSPDPTYSGQNSYLTNHCTSCHPGLHGHAFDEQNNPLLEKMPYGPPSTQAPGTPASVLPLFDPLGAANQNPFMGGMVCSTCHDPHEPSYSYGSDGMPKFLRVGSPSNINQLCSACHDAPFPSGAAPDLVIPSRSNSVSFTTTPWGDQHIEVTVKNRGNAFYTGGSALVSWVDNMGYPMTIGTLWFPSISPDQETTTNFIWMPPPGWAAGEGFYVFSLPPSDLVFGVSKEFVRAMDVLPAPQNLRVNWAGPQWIDLAWNMVPPDSGPVTYDVYRDGVKINIFGPVSGSSYVDNGVAPETPHVYTVKAVDPIGNFSAPSNLAVGTTQTGMISRVPQDFPTIQAAIDAAQPGTSIHVAPGIYTEHLDFGDRQQVTVKGQDANGCIFDYTSVNGGVITLGYPGYLNPGNTLSGFTIRNAVVNMGEGDALVGCVLVNDGFNPYPVVRGGGLVAQCVIDTVYAPSIEIYSFLASVNSIYLGSMPFDSYPSPPEYATLLINNNFYYWPMWPEYPGSGNFSGNPAFEYPGPPSRYYTTNNSVTIDRGLPLGTPETYNGAAPDVGVFEVGRPYTPQPPGVLTATFQPGPAGSVQLVWSLSVGAPQGIWNYLIYRSTTPSFPSDPEAQPFMAVPWYEWTFTDFDIVPGTTYYYQVRADGGPAYPPATGQLLSGPTNTASAGDLNRPPVAVDDGFTTNEDLPLTYPAMLWNDSDPDGDPLTLESIGQPQHGTAVINPDQQTVLYTPTPDYYGPDSFVYTVADGRWGSASATVNIQVNPVNDPPVALPDSYTVPEDSTLNIPAPGVLANDIDIEGDPLIAIRMGDPGFGTLALSPIGAVTYTPFVNFNGTDTFNYRPTDEKYGSSAAVAVTITVTPVNDPPTFGPVWDQIVGEDAGLQTVVGWANGIDDGDPEVAQALSFSTTNTNSALFQVQPAVSPSGTLTYQPKDNMGGGTAIVTATLTDDSQAGGPAKSAAIQFTITVGSVNYAPVANGQSVTTGEDTAKSVTLAATDADGDPLTYVVLPPANGMLSGVAPNLTYTPNANYNGPDSFTFVANDGAVDSNTATVAITVTPVNDPPVFVMGANQMVNNDAGPQFVAGWATGIGDGDPEVSQVLMFNVTNDNNALFAVQPIIFPDGTLSCMPAANAGGVATVTVSLTDDFSAGGPAITTPARTFTITVNRPPVAMEQWVTTARNTPLSVTLGAWDMDGDALTYAVVSSPAHGSLSGIAPNLTYTPALDYNGPDSLTFTAYDGQATSASATVTIKVNVPPVANAGADQTGNIGQVISFSSAASSDPDGTITFSSWNWGDSSAAGYSGIGVATHTYANPGTYVVTLTVVDNDGAAATDVLTVTVNAPPAALSQTVTIGEDTAVAVTLSATDIDGDALTYAVVTGPSHGTLTGTAPNLTYTPAANYTGPDSFTFTANDGKTVSNLATVAITVTAVNDAPVSAGQDVTTAEDTAVAVTLSATDIDGDALTYAVVTGPSHGTLTGTAPNLTYTPAANYTGPDSFTFTANDGKAASNVATVAITVTAVNDAPVAAGQNVTTAEDTAVAVTLSATDIDGDALTYAVATGPAHGTLSGSGLNLTYTPAANYNGPDSFTFVANDGTIGSNVAAVSITVTAVNDLPTANAGPDQTGLAGQVLSFSGAASSDVEGPIANYSWSWGDSTANGSGVSPTHAWTAAGTYTVTLTVTDNGGATATDTLVVTVTKVNLALNKSATASTTYDDATTAAKAVDGTTATFWRSRSAGTQSVYVDLGSAKSISNVKVRWPATYYARSFKIETSTDKKKWTLKKSYTEGNGSLTDLTFTPASARYVRVSCTIPASTTYGVAELEVYQ